MELIIGGGIALAACVVLLLCASRKKRLSATPVSDTTQEGSTHSSVKPATTPRPLFHRGRTVPRRKMIDGQMTHYYPGGTSPAGHYYRAGYYDFGGLYYSGIHPWLGGNIKPLECLEDELYDIDSVPDWTDWNSPAPADTNTDSSSGWNSPAPDTNTDSGSGWSSPAPGTNTDSGSGWSSPAPDTNTDSGSGWGSSSSDSGGGSSFD